jgi:hypothetical protein
LRSGDLVELGAVVAFSDLGVREFGQSHSLVPQERGHLLAGGEPHYLCPRLRNARFDLWKKGREIAQLGRQSRIDALGAVELVVWNREPRTAGVRSCDAPSRGEADVGERRSREDPLWHPPRHLLSYRNGSKVIDTRGAKPRDAKPRGIDVVIASYGGERP